MEGIITIPSPLSSSRSSKYNYRNNKPDASSLFDKTSGGEDQESSLRILDNDDGGGNEVMNETELGTVTLLERGTQYLVVDKPPTVVCHHSDWTGLRSKKKDDDRKVEVPMLQRVRDAFGNGKRVNVIHRLDRGASGCLLFAYADDDDKSDDGEEKKIKQKGATAILTDAMTSNEATKTYVALVRGEGILSGEDLKTKGWFPVDRPIKDESGISKNATTFFRFIAGQASDGNNARGGLVLARPVTGRWHQVRRHLNGLSHPILGDSTHGSSTTNREWKEQRNMPGARTFLHLSRLQLPPNAIHGDAGMDVSSPFPSDMLQLLKEQLPQVYKNALPILEEEGILVHPTANYETGTFIIPSNDIE